jgi:hypothetical protein
MAVAPVCIRDAPLRGKLAKTGRVTLGAAFGLLTLPDTTRKQACSSPCFPKGSGYHQDAWPRYVIPSCISYEYTENPARMPATRGTEAQCAKRATARPALFATGALNACFLYTIMLLMIHEAF